MIRPRRRRSVRGSIIINKIRAAAGLSSTARANTSKRDERVGSPADRRTLATTVVFPNATPCGIRSARIFTLPLYKHRTPSERTLATNGHIHFARSRVVIIIITHVRRNNGRHRRNVQSTRLAELDEWARPNITKIKYRTSRVPFKQPRRWTPSIVRNPFCFTIVLVKPRKTAERASG